MNTNLTLITRLSNQQLSAQLKLHAQHEREATAALIAHLAIFDERRLYLDEGCSSTFTYCVEILHLSEAATGKRIAVARAARTYPVILELLAEGSVNLSTVLLLAPHFTLENHVRLLTSTQHKSKRQVEEFVAALRPLPPVTSVIRKLPTPRNAAADMADPPSDPTALPPASGATSNDEPLVGTGSMPVRVSTLRRSVVQPLAPDRFKVEFTASADTREKLQRAQDLLRHQIPDGNLDKVINKALTGLLEKLAKQKMAETDKPRNADHSNPPERSSSSRHIRADVRRKVWKRDGGQCAFVAQSGHRCKERAFLEYHHVVPYGAGGKATVENIQLRCRAHNGHEARLYFGDQAFRWKDRDDSNGRQVTTRPGASLVTNPIMEQMMLNRRPSDG